VLPPRGRTKLEARYGKLELARAAGDGYVIASPAGWEQRNMVGIRSGLLPKGKLYVHKDLAGPLLRALAAASLQAPTYRVETIGCWSVRYKRSNAGAVSVHAWGLAVDINAESNPMRKRIVTDMPPLFVDAFAREGFTWGGTFPTPDPMHFQLCSGY
jgi:hypothetical protein